MARAGMSALIKTLRLNASAGENSDNVNGVQYWTDDQLQDILDQFSSDLLDTELIPYPVNENGATVYKVYYLPSTTSRFIEGADTASAFTLVDTLGNTVTGYTFDASRGRFEFATPTGGRTYRLRARQFDMNQATAEVWFRKAGLRAELIDWKAGTYNLKEDQIWQHCMAMYQKWAGKNTFNRVRLDRVDYGYSGE